MLPRSLPHAFRSLANQTCTLSISPRVTSDLPDFFLMACTANSTLPTHNQLQSQQLYVSVYISLPEHVVVDRN